MADNQTESIAQVVAKRGGPRLGAGRKPKDVDVWMAARGIDAATAAELLNNSDERKKWHRVLNSDDDRVLLSALIFLTSMRDGKPSQQINVTSTNLTLNARDIQQARDIVREIRGEIPNAGIAASNNPSLGDCAGSPLQVDAEPAEHNSPE